MKQNEKDYKDSLLQDEQRYEDKHIKKQYKVVQPDLINPDDLLGLQEPMDIDVRDLVNVNDETDRIMANPEDFPEIGEIVNESQFYLKNCGYCDDQGVHNGEFAFRVE